MYSGRLLSCYTDFVRFFLCSRVRCGYFRSGLVPPHCDCIKTGMKYVVCVGGGGGGGGTPGNPRSHVQQYTI